MTASGAPPAVAERIGDRAPRGEDRRLLSGTASYVEDVAVPDGLHAVLVRSDHAHARLLEIDAEEARAAPGVRLVLTHAELAASELTTIPLDLAPPGHEVSAFAQLEQPILARDEVRYIGQPVAFVVAERLEQALDAAELLVTDFEELDAVADLHSALEGEAAAALDQPNNVLFEYEEGDADEVERHFRACPHVVSVEVRNNRVHALPLEPRGCIGVFDGASGCFTLHVSTQRAHIIQRALADRVFRVPRDRMRVVAPDVGGGFGQKNGLYPEYVLCLEAARRLGRPVRWAEGRMEAFACDNHGRDNLFVAAAAVEEDGRIRAVRATRLMNLGAYAAPRSMVTVANGLTHLTGVYGVSAAHVTVRGIATNTASTSPYRGAGRPENVLCCEALVDAIARELSLDPIALRRRNLVRPEAMPWVSPLGTRFAATDIGAVLDTALAEIDYEGLKERRRAARARGRARGLGMSLFAEDLHGSDEAAPVRLGHAGGKLVVYAGTGSAGHGHETSFLQIVSDRLGLPRSRLRFVQSDTAEIPDGIGTAASWSITLGGSSALIASEAAVAQATRIAAGVAGRPEDDVVFDNGVFRVTGTNFVVGWDDIFAAEPEFSARGAYDGRGETVSVGCHACEVEVDPETGAIRVLAYAVAQDCGRAVNPMLVEGQLHGGVAQGIGQGWGEEVVYDRAGQLLSGSLMDYAVPLAGDLPPIATSLARMPATDNPLQVKGIGESAATGSPPAFINAVHDALAPLGVTRLDPPLTPFRVWEAIARARGSHAG